MKRWAIFVEGQTEQLFVERLIKSIAGTKQVSLIKQKASGGNKNNRSFLEISAGSENETEYYVLVVDCGSDGSVKSDICDQFENLSKAGYQKIIGLRDVYPKVLRNDINKLRIGLAMGLPSGSPSILFVLCVMEIEAWILAEDSHYPRFNSEITADRVNVALGFDIVNDDLSQRNNPAKDLADVYWLESIPYDKSAAIIERVLNALDFERLGTVVRSKFKDLDLLYCELSSFFSAPTG